MCLPYVKHLIQRYDTIADVMITFVRLFFSSLFSLFVIVRVSFLQCARALLLLSQFAVPICCPGIKRITCNVFDATYIQTESYGDYGHSCCNGLLHAHNCLLIRLFLFFFEFYVLASSFNSSWHRIFDLCALSNTRILIYWLIPPKNVRCGFGLTIAIKHTITVSNNAIWQISFCQLTY